jgi:hypothetical protein
MKTKPTTIAGHEAKPGHLGLAPKAHRRPGVRVRVQSPRTVTVTLAEVIAAVQDCTDNDELVVSVLAHLLRTGQARSLPGFNMIDRCAAA